ncbi:MAG TPA: hypothetical protein VL967_09275 [Terracidiphilus sp.]|nr:hypothetical protein [Terracidiphilus sp.]
MPNPATEEIRSSGALSQDLGRELANGFHAMAQPLTILRGALGALALTGAVAPASQRYLEMSSLQIDRLCGMLSTLQGLLDTAQCEADSSAFDLAAVISLVLDDLEPALRKSGVQIQASSPDQPVPVIGDAGRSEMALRACLQIAASISSPGDKVDIKCRVDDAFAHLTMAHERMRGAELSSLDRLSLALAEANLRSQQGFFACIQDPFQSSLRFPLQSSSAPTSGASQPCSSVCMLH